MLFCVEISPEPRSTKAPGEDDEVQRAVTSPTTALHHEAQRIRNSYSRRDNSVDAERYSPFVPGNLYIRQELERCLLHLLRQRHRSRLSEQRILEIGCGRGYWLRELIRWGAKPDHLYGVDLMSEYIDDAKRLSSPFLNLKCADASKLPYGLETFDLVAQFTVFTSVLDASVRHQIASEMLRVLKPGGAVLWYDFHVNNPQNPDVRGVGAHELHELFPLCQVHLKRITVVPPIARRLPAMPLLYSVLSATKIACTHYLALIEKL